MNAYLTYAAMIGAGLYGIEHELRARARVQGQRLRGDGLPADAARAVRGDRGARAERGGGRDLRPGRRRPLPQRRSLSSSRSTTRSSTPGTASAISSAVVNARRWPRAADQQVDERSHDGATSTPSVPASPSSRRARPSTSDRGAGPGRSLPHRRGRERGERPPGVLPRDPRDRRRPDVRGELLHRAVRRWAPGDQLPVLRRHRRHRPPRSRTPGIRSVSGMRRGVTAYVLRTGRAGAHLRRERHHELVAAGEIETLGVVAAGRLARCAASRRTAGRSASSSCQTYSQQTRGTDGRPRPPRLRRAAHRIGAEPRPGDRGDAPAQRGAGAGQRDRPGARASSSTSRRSSSSSGSASGPSSTANSMFIALYDAETHLISFPYELDEGGRSNRADRARSKA